MTIGVICFFLGPQWPIEDHDEVQGPWAESLGIDEEAGEAKFCNDRGRGSISKLQPLNSLSAGRQTSRQPLGLN